MIGLPSGARVWLAVGRTDMRRGFDGLAAAVQERMAQDPFCGHLFVFRGRRGDLLKVLWWDGQGLCLFAKRLEKGRFVWPSPADGKVVITPAQLGMLHEGIDWRMPRRTWRRLWPDELRQSESAAILVAPRAAGHDSMSGCRSRPISFPTMHKR